MGSTKWLNCSSYMGSTKWLNCASCMGSKNGWIVHHTWEVQNGWIVHHAWEVKMVELCIMHGNYRMVELCNMHGKYKIDSRQAVLTRGSKPFSACYCSLSSPRMAAPSHKQVAYGVPRKFCTTNFWSAGETKLSKNIEERHGDSRSPAKYYAFVNTYWGCIYIGCMSQT
jgi:hypothetical protein